MFVLRRLSKRGRELKPIEVHERAYRWALHHAMIVSVDGSDFIRDHESYRQIMERDALCTNHDYWTSDTRSMAQVYRLHRPAAKEMIEYIDPNRLIEIEKFADQLRLSPTAAEIRAKGLLDSIRDVTGFKFQCRIATFVVDFYSKRARLAVEIDGDIHDGRQEKDQARDALLGDLFGVVVMRFRNEFVFSSPLSFTSQVREAALELIVRREGRE